MALFFLLCLVLSSFIIGVYVFKYHVSRKNIPSPPLSDSYSLNEKLGFLRTTDKMEPSLGIGSSIALNNLHSETISNRIMGGKFLNASSWGMNMSDNYYLLKSLCEVYHPRTIFIASSISEFELPAKKVDYDKVKSYLTAGDAAAVMYHFTCFNVRYYMDNWKYKKLVTTEKNQYEYLVFDQFGGVNIEGNGFKIDQRRWNASFEKKRINESNYAFLDSISTLCKLKGIGFYFFQSPFREGIYANLDAQKAKDLKSHVERIETILKRDHHMFVDADKVKWNDSLFIDGEHLNEKGAKAFTEYCFNQLDSLEVSPIHLQ